MIIINKTVSVFVVAYNEENTVGKVLKKLLKLDFITEIIVIDNGSFDDTNKILTDIAQKNNIIKLYKIEKNKGLGFGVARAIKESSGEIVVRQDADLEYDPDELINMVEVIDKGLADVVYGSRMLVRKAHRVHYFYSYLANVIISTFSNLMTNLFLSDVETAAKAFNGKVVRSIDWHANGFEIENEMTIKLKKIGCQFYEVPYSYYGRKFEEGKKIRTLDGFRAIFFIIYYTISVLFINPQKK